MASAPPSDTGAPAAFPVDDSFVEMQSSTRVSKRARGEDPSPSKGTPSAHAARSLASGGAGGQASKETSPSAWNLSFDSPRDDQKKEPSDAGSSSESEESDDDHDEDGCLSGSRIMDMRRLHEVSKNFCCKNCAISLVENASDQRRAWLDEFSTELIVVLGDGAAEPINARRPRPRALKM